MHRPLLLALTLFFSILIPARSIAGAPHTIEFEGSSELKPNETLDWDLGEFPAGTLLEWSGEIPRFDLVEGDRIALRLAADGQPDVTKELNAGDRTMLVPIVIKHEGPVRITAESSSDRELPLNLKLRE
ncbi:MAG: hypothetical protein KC964_15085, partial [Candidatus Omnitrophica bacterium]|nr:hypothetical protein [Candidatus Omnitrophota bacterium]